ncbi:MAG: magnesium transporter CorA family protein [Verrucomicrobia bacterium]|nr:magnesium transporter CorA family protein [Verrucomicrobiota bacterium]
MIRSHIFRDGRLYAKDSAPDFLRIALGDEDVHIWVDLEAPTDAEAKQILEAIFNFHPLAVEDCITVSERPKVDEYENHLFLVIHAVDYSSHEFQTTEIDFFIGRNFLVTYHREPVRAAGTMVDLIHKNPLAYARAPDRLAYHLIDLIVDNYGPALDDLTKDFEVFESELLERPSRDFLQRIVPLRGQVQRLRAFVGPQREVLSRIALGEFPIVRKTLLPYFRDLLNRLARINDVADGYRESLNGLLQLHLGIQQMQVNSVIKVLTVMATLALPLVAIASYYGMNFPLPEFAMTGHHGHIWVGSLTLAITGGLYLFLRLRKWL